MSLSNDEKIEKLSNALAASEELRKRAVKKIEALEKAKDQAYWERNQLIVYLSKHNYSHLQLHDPNDKEWEDDWRNIVCIHLLAGVTPPGATFTQVSETKFMKDETLREMQFTWHIHDDELKYFKHLRYKPNHWDGHTTEEKYKNLASL